MRSVNWSLLYKGSHTRQVLQGICYTRSADIFKQFMEKVTGKVNLPSETDLPTGVYIALFAGQYKMGGYALEIKKIHIQDYKIRLIYRLKKPSPSDMVSMVFTQPYLTLVIHEFPEDGNLIVEGCQDKTDVCVEAKAMEAFLTDLDERKSEE